MAVFTQCACVLFDEVPSLDELGRALEGWRIATRQEPAPGDDGWAACGPGFVVELRSGGSVVVDLVGHPWPDDPGGTDAPAIAAAWRSGVLGPSSSPGALARARAQAWAWAEGAAAAGRHRGLVRLRTVVELEAVTGGLPEDHDPVHELSTLTELAAGALRMPGATGVFFPGGEALRSREQVEAVLRQKAGLASPPIELWMNTRGIGLGQEGDARWVLVDVVGMRQVRQPDQEALFAEGREAPEAAAALLRNACLRLIAGKGIPVGSTAADARGRRWKVSAAACVLAPNRPVLRWLPEEGPGPSDGFLAKLPRPSPGVRDPPGSPPPRDEG